MKRRSTRGSITAPKISSPLRLSGDGLRLAPGDAGMGRAAESGKRVLPGGAHLEVEEPPVAAAVLEERRVRAALDDASVSEEQDFVGVHQRREPVRNDDRGAAA